MLAVNQKYYEEYFQYINDEFVLMNKKLKNLIKDKVALGNENESILREFLKNYIPKHYSIGQGFIFKNRNEISKQCDIILYDSSFFPPIFKKGDFVVLMPEAVLSVIEVKAEIKTGKDFLISAIENIKSARILNNRISGLIFGYRGSLPATILNGLTKYYKGNKIDLKYIFELLVNIERGYCISLKRVNDEQILFILDAMLKGDDPEFVFSTHDTEKQTFNIFFFYIMRQIRTYIYNTFINDGKISPFLMDFSTVPLTPPGGLKNIKGYFDNRKKDIKALHCDLRYGKDKDLLGVFIK
jgi:hypothetical protein